MANTQSKSTPRADSKAKTICFHGLWTRNEAMKQTFHIVERAARREASVLVRGETGTGKEHIAHAIHALSPRANKPLRAVNCAAIPPALLESELFGHVRGAFTGAVQDVPGIFRTASGGTLFLDEVAEMPLDLQAKMLRVLQTKSVVPVGGRDPIAVDVRIVCATNTSLRMAVATGRFRADLMYRLRVVPIFLPPLRERRDDILMLTQKLIEVLNAEGGRRIDRVADDARHALESYAWPGNVRELRNMLEYAFVIGDGPELRARELPPEIFEPPIALPEQSLHTSTSHDANERLHIQQALREAKGNRAGAAHALNMSRVTLWRRMKELNIAPW